MSTNLCSELQELKCLVRQQEETLSQLIQMVASTNRHLFDLRHRQTVLEHQSTPYSISSK
ncbi:hypothetical protein N781_13755 [Pontibacillus halophilus JSM 076056 = DSM 19796]|uniref:Uncharacterized protein n=1 Tax=Pontibacillus halophilus JSM 076056 = DSM 19796 TaxID=1385510 RepID=A0A0A5GII6_9BACI|nr:hypothetical protein [Pontibacillus halophilus]KGX93051.1 hypothetical protein N781_13755 [Pontibacillus halophilus JSM 076056 = DSM 19796]